MENSSISRETIWFSLTVLNHLAFGWNNILSSSSTDGPGYIHWQPELSWRAMGIFPRHSKPSYQCYVLCNTIHSDFPVWLAHSECENVQLAWSCTNYIIYNPSYGDAGLYGVVLGHGFLTLSCLFLCFWSLLHLVRFVVNHLSPRLTYGSSHGNSVDAAV